MKCLYFIIGIFYYLCLYSVCSVEDVCLEVGWKDRHVPTVNDTRKCLRSSRPSKFVALVARVVVGLPNAGRCGGGRGGCPLARLKSYDAEARKYGTDWPPFGINFFNSNP